MKRDPLPRDVLSRKALVYVRQSTPGQVHGNLESQRRQYDLVQVARDYGFRDVEVIDEDQGVSACGAADRPGFERLVAELCAGLVGAVVCLEASRLARNGRDWHHLLEFCGLVDARVIDVDGVYDPRRPNDRLLLGMKGTISEFEISVLRTRLVEAARSKAKRGELRIPVPVGYVWDRESGVRLDDDLRLQEVIRLVFRKFEELGSARQVLLWMQENARTFPHPSGAGRGVSPRWTPIRYRNVISVLKNPFYAGAYAYGKSQVQIEIRDGHAHRIYGRQKPREAWDVLLRDHHPGYVSWAQYERNQAQLDRNAYGRRGGAKSGRGGRALLAGLLMCGRCGRRLHVVYTGNAHAPKYRCDPSNFMPGPRRCMAFAAWRADRLVREAVLRVVAPIAVEASREAERMRQTHDAERRRVVELDLQQARYEASLAERRYAACDPDHRLTAAQLERAWEEALQRVQACEERLAERDGVQPKESSADLGDLAGDLDAAWSAPTTTMRARQQLVRALVEDIIADVDEAKGEIVLTIHWKGGQHTELRTRKPRSGEHRRRAPEEAAKLIRSMAGTWSDEHIAASLNRMGFHTGQNESWTADRVSSFRRRHDIPADQPAEGDGAWLTMTAAAQALGVTRHVMRRLIREGVLPAQQVVPGAPYEIRAADLRDEHVQAAIRRVGRPCHSGGNPLDPLFPGLFEGGAQ